MWSKGICWIDDCRIPFVDEGDKWIIDRDKEIIISNPQHSGRDDIKWKREGLDNSNNQGRFPANILVSDDMLNDGIITKQNPRKYKADIDIKETSLLGFGDTKDKIQEGDKGSSSRYYDIDKWFDKILNYE